MFTRYYSVVQHSKCVLPSTAVPTPTTISTVLFHERCSRTCIPNYDPWEREGCIYLPKLRSTRHRLLQIILDADDENLPEFFIPI
jgi:hypothetical protein